MTYNILNRKKGVVGIYAAVVPAQNEAGRVGVVIDNLATLPFQAIIPVLNGCTDSSLQEVLAIGNPCIKPIHFYEALGIDIPRAVGAAYALKLGLQGVVFVDGDMTGKFENHLQSLLAALKQGVDLALVNCYPYITHRQSLTKTVLYFRGRLNRELGVFKDLGLASPAHGPHALSKRLLEILDLKDLAVPSMVLAKAKKNELNIKVVTSIPHALLSSPIRQRSHARKVAHTIIGDCLEALNYINGDAISRTYGKHTFDGYNSSRRFDLLMEWEENLTLDNQTYLWNHLVNFPPQLFVPTNKVPPTNAQNLAKKDSPHETLDLD